VAEDPGERAEKRILKSNVAWQRKENKKQTSKRESRAFFLQRKAGNREEKGKGV